MSELTSLPKGYAELLEGLKSRISGAQVRAALAVTRELVLLYWSIGRDLSERFEQEGWGTRINEPLGKDLQASFPGIEGFSPRNLRYMRSFAEAWPETEVLQQLVAKLPWGHNLQVLDRLKDRPTREWYLRAALEHGWSRNVLVHMIYGQLHAREGNALTNFQRTLPPSGSDLAEQVLRDPLLSAFRVHVVGNVRRPMDRLDCDRHLITLRDGGGEAYLHVIAVSYPTAACLPALSRLDTDSDESNIVRAVRELYEQLGDALTPRLAGLPFVTLGHLHVRGGAESEGAERRILVGGQHAVPHDVFPSDAVYVALGHLHKAQHVGAETIRYSGSLIPFPPPSSPTHTE